MVGKRVRENPLLDLAADGEAAAPMGGFGQQQQLQLGKNDLKQMNNNDDDEDAEGAEETT